MRHQKTREIFLTAILQNQGIALLYVIESETLQEPLHSLQRFGNMFQRVTVGGADKPLSAFSESRSGNESDFFRIKEFFAEVFGRKPG